MEEEKTIVLRNHTSEALEIKDGLQEVIKNFASELEKKGLKAKIILKVAKWRKL